MRMDNHKRYEAEAHALILPSDQRAEGRERVGGLAALDWVKVHTTREHSQSSYGIQVWVDDEGCCYGSIFHPSVFCEIRNIREVPNAEEY